jgi:predicted AAA+ superfamily ATPase
MQDVWDRNKADAKINLVVCGSMNSLLNKIFRDKKEPLYGRQTDMIKVRAFAPSVLKEIMAEYNLQYSKEDLLALYLLTGGVAKYVELFADRRILTKDDMIDAFFEKDSYFLTEGKSMLIEEFGKEYGTYFSILSLIAQGHNTRSDIESILGIEIGGYIKKLVDDYELITKRQPLFENAVNKNVRYALEDNFLKFWFRFVFRYEYMLEAGANAKLKNLVNADYEAYSGRILEAYFRESLIEQGLFTRIGYWHSRNGQNEIDIIGQDESAKKAVFYEVKRQKDNIDIAVLKEKAQAFLTATHEFKKYDIEYVGVSMEDM